MAEQAIRLAPNLSMPLDAVTETFAILASKGKGKSSLATRMVEQMHAAGLPVVVLDPKGDWWGLRTSADGNGPGLPFVIFGGDHPDVPLEPTAGELIADLIVDDRVSCVLDLSHMSKTKARSFATAFAERLYFRNRDPLHVVIDEADVLIPQRADATTARLIGAMEDIAKRGRGHGLGITIATQRGQEVAKSVLDLVETLFLLGMAGSRTIGAVRDWIQVNADNDEVSARDVIGSLPALGVGEGWVWSPAFLRTVRRVGFDKFATFDSHATPKPGQRRIAPKGRAEIDLVALGAEIAATVERAKAADPKSLRHQVAQLERQLAAATAGASADGVLIEEVTRLRGDLAQKGAALETARRELDTERRTQRTVQSALRSRLADIDDLIDSLYDGSEVDAAPAPFRPAKRPPPAMPAPSQRAAAPARAPRQPALPEPELKLRSGARRMVESLGRMAPLRLTKSQWGTVAKLRTTGGTWSTYLGEIRRAGLIDENDIGFTLTDDGFDYLGGRPDPMTAAELQQHYRSILRAGAVKMLDALMASYPAGLSRDELGEAADIVVTGGTFSTYLGELIRNGLAERDGASGAICATAILMTGAAR